MDIAVASWPVEHLARTPEEPPPGRRENFVWHWCRHPGFNLTTKYPHVRRALPQPC